jgi:Zn-dependent protease with chaperone function
MDTGTQVRTRRILRDIDPSAWEHPADKAALQALRRIPVFDQVLKALFGVFGEKPIRLTFQANAVRVGRRQFPDVYDCYLEVCETLDVEKPYPLFVSQTPIVNAGAYGMKEPFIVLNSGSIRLLDRDEMTYLLGHEVGHVLSGHVLY